MDAEKLVHDLVVERMKRRLGRDYKEIRVNASGLPDMELRSHGLTLAVVEVETEGGVTPERAAGWAELAAKGTRLILMVPRKSKVKATELLWQKGVMDRVSVGTYEIQIDMP
ncbi:MAG: hypothetical protein Kow0025_23580 [Thermodesulfovibrionales bacterium]